MLIQLYLVSLVLILMKMIRTMTGTGKTTRLFDTVGMAEMLGQDVTLIFFNNLSWYVHNVVFNDIHSINSLRN